MIHKDRKELSNLINYNLLFPSEAASLLGVSRASFSNMVARGNFQPIKTGIGGALFLRSEILRYKEAKAYMKRVIRSGSIQGPDSQPNQYPLLLTPAEPTEPDVVALNGPTEEGRASQ